jgi:hypothetical protein
MSQIVCPQGSYCKSGVKKKCPSGSYGQTNGLSDERCDGKCLPGFYCPLGSISNRQDPCGDRSMFCPLGSKEPKKVSIGFYSYNSTLVESGDIRMQNATMSWQKKCEHGHFCEDGVRYQCPAGTFGYQEGMSSKNDCLQCRRGTCSSLSHFVRIFCLQSFDTTTALTCLFCDTGYYCPSEPGKPSTNAKQFRCGSVDKYCPDKTGSPQSVDIGYYTLGGEGFGVNGTLYRTSQEMCPQGSYCVNGMRVLCPAGFWGGSLGLSFKMCSGFCPAGYYCEEGTDHPRECPENSYSAEGWSKCIPCAFQNIKVQRCKTDRSCCNQL